MNKKPDEKGEPDSEQQPVELRFLKPRETLNIAGKLIYKESLGSWNILHLRKEILDIFPQLKERRGKFGYAMYYNRSAEELKKLLEELEKDDLTPILLLLGRIRD